MKKTCEDCKEYWEARARYHKDGKLDHRCILVEKVCADFKLSYTRDVCLKKFPALVAHLICESLGYFTPMSAANALSFHKARKPFCCEWFSHMAQFVYGREQRELMFNDAAVMEVQKRAIRLAFKNRHHHHGYMSEYKQAKSIVAAELKDKGCTSSMLASWF